ncbi:C-type lectin domain family 10 member A [Xenopus laevis]|uniref:C-type lectin domain family 10 member A n=2 Tax=Xenopus laevis TaxID=8355 RepID=A0A1L8F0R1_XENLA|nr:C-type lectin domain family 10 member A [Xenopus laevis]OCT65191.1 hypothetical protein XELAEV_18041430mg [Xenopus laevis]
MSENCTLTVSQSKRVLYLALWSRDLGRNLRLSPMTRGAVADSAMDRSALAELEFRTLTDQVCWNSDTLRRDAMSTNNVICMKPVRNQRSCRWRCLLAGEIFLVILFFVAIIFLLPLYLQDYSHLQRNQQQMEALRLNMSDSMEERIKRQEASHLLSNNVSSLKQNVSFLHEVLIPELRLNQTQLLQDIVRLETSYRNQTDQYGALQETYAYLKGSYYFLPKESPLLHNCNGQDSKNGYRVCPFCLHGWYFFGMSCYLLSSDPQSWEESSLWCRKEGGHLVVISSIEEQNSLQDLVNETVWIGLSDREVEGEWRWEDGSPFGSGPRFWAPGRPNNSGDDDCITLLPAAGWKDDSCIKLYTGVCEDSAGELTLPSNASLV